MDNQFQSLNDSWLIQINRWPESYKLRANVSVSDGPAFAETWLKLLRETDLQSCLVKPKL